MPRISYLSCHLPRLGPFSTQDLISPAGLRIPPRAGFSLEEGLLGGER